MSLCFMNESAANTKKPAIFMIASLVLLFAPGVGDLRWIGLITFLYIGLPWYILAVKDKLESNLSYNEHGKRKLHIRSMILLIFGFICVVVGVGIDLFILYQLYSNPSPTALGSAVARLFAGVPFFGFGVYVVYLSLGWVSNET